MLFDVDAQQVEISAKTSMYISLSFSADEDDILDNFEQEYLMDYIDKDSFLYRLNEEDLIDYISWECVKDYFKDEITEELSFVQHEVLDKIGWENVRDYFKDYIDGEISEAIANLREEMK